MADEGTQRIPPYVSFSTFWNFVEELNSRGPAPQVLERNIFGPTRSGASVYELLQAFRSLGLVDDEKRPTGTGRQLIENPSTEGLRAIVEARYGDALALGLENATTGQLDAVLRDMGHKEGGATLRKARTFFLQAAEKSGYTIGPHLRPRSIAGRSSVRRPKASKAAAKLGENGAKPPPTSELVTRYVELLMDKVKEQEQPTEDLLNRIERALKLPPSETEVQK